MKQIIVVHSGNHWKHEQLLSTLEYERHIIFFSPENHRKQINIVYSGNHTKHIYPCLLWQT